MESNYTKAYGRSSSANQKSRQLLHAFDKLSTTTHKDVPLTSGIKLKALSNIDENSDGCQNETCGMRLSVTEKNPDICALFESPAHLESLPKKARRAAAVGSKAAKKGSKQTNSNTKPKMKKISPAAFPDGEKHAAKNIGASFLSSPDLPSIEKFRDFQKPFSPRPARYQDLDTSHNKSSLSLDDSSIEDLVIEYQRGVHRSQAQTPFRFAEPVKPIGHSKQSFGSFVKIRTPSTDTITASIGPGIVDSQGEDSSSYTSVYKWVTESSTATVTCNTPGIITQSGATKQCTQTGPALEVSSPKLVFKSYDQDNLHSTAIHPMSGVCMQCIPQVSPIRPITNLDAKHWTPSAPTHKCSPRGPRKAQSFTSKSARGVHAKCSTTLFASPIADAGDAPLDVSSIRAALSEAVESERDDARTCSSDSYRDDSAFSIFTSTPCARGRKKLTWNLSSVHAVAAAADDDDDLLPLRTSDRIVNSQEIVADSISDSSVSMAGDQCAGDFEREEPSRKDKMKQKTQSESGFQTDSSTMVQNKITSTVVSHKVATEDDLNDIHPVAEHRTEFPNPAGSGILNNDSLEGLIGQNRMSRAVQQATQVMKGISNNWQTESGTGKERALSGSAAPSLGDKVTNAFDEDVPKCHHDMPVAGVVAVAGSSGRVASKRKLTEKGVAVEPCPISTLGLEGGPHPDVVRPQLMMWVEPHDSGFLDMVCSAPPDVIGVVSEYIRDHLPLP